MSLNTWWGHLFVVLFAIPTDEIVWSAAILLPLISRFTCGKQEREKDVESDTVVSVKKGFGYPYAKLIAISSDVVIMVLWHALGCNVFLELGERFECCHSGPHKSLRSLFFLIIYIYLPFFLCSLLYGYCLMILLETHDIFFSSLLLGTLIEMISCFLAIRTKKLVAGIVFKALLWIAVIFV